MVVKAVVKANSQTD